MAEARGVRGVDLERLIWNIEALETETQAEHRRITKATDDKRVASKPGINEDGTPKLIGRRP